MDRRDFVEGCALGGGALAASLSTGSWAAQAAPRHAITPGRCW
ncbi:twin-arginine translocation signal domain-containing protein [Hydrogenophaga pseudoflava]|nr:twin-arginine translocation signal domain-containing protein [Hydrogenophaga pseudoflava]MDQ7744432.1 twin-arginine translocation signal domain-containing protein [Hydrogenophaga pseudoflava]